MSFKKKQKYQKLIDEEEEEDGGGDDVNTGSPIQVTSSSSSSSSQVSPLNNEENSSGLVTIERSISTNKLNPFQVDSDSELGFSGKVSNFVNSVRGMGGINISANGREGPAALEASGKYFETSLNWWRIITIGAIVGIVVLISYATMGIFIWLKTIIPGLKEFFETWLKNIWFLIAIVIIKDIIVALLFSWAIQRKTWYQTVFSKILIWIFFGFWVLLNILYLLFICVITPTWLIITFMVLEAGILVGTYAIAIIVSAWLQATSYMYDNYSSWIIQTQVVLLVLLVGLAWSLIASENLDEFLGTIFLFPYIIALIFLKLLYFCEFFRKRKYDTYGNVIISSRGRSAVCNCGSSLPQVMPGLSVIRKVRDASGNLLKFEKITGSRDGVSLGNSIFNHLILGANANDPTLLRNQSRNQKNNEMRRNIKRAFIIISYFVSDLTTFTAFGASLGLFPFQKLDVTNIPISSSAANKNLQDVSYAYEKNKGELYDLVRDELKV